MTPDTSTFGIKGNSKGRKSFRYPILIIASDGLKAVAATLINTSSEPTSGIGASS
jgi:hypothetical protein